MKEAKTREIGGVRYRVSYLKTSKAQAMLSELAKLVGPALATLVGGASDKVPVASAEVAGLLNKVKPDLLKQAVTELTARLDNDKVSKIVDDLRKVSQICVGEDEDKWISLEGAVYETNFMGAMKAWAQWLQFALEVQFADFFE